MFADSQWEKGLCPNYSFLLQFVLWLSNAKSGLHLEKQ